MRRGGIIFAEGPATTAVWNPADKNASVVLADANRSMSKAGAGVGAVRSTVGKSTGKHYAEFLVLNTGGASLSIGFATSAYNLSLDVGGDAGSQGYQADGDFLIGGSSTPGWAAFAAGDIIRVCAGLSTSLLWWGRNGAWQNGDPSAGTGGSAVGGVTVFLAAAGQNGAAAMILPSLNYPAPTGASIW